MSRRTRVGWTDTLRGRYLVQNPVANLGLRAVDAVLRAAVPRHPAAAARADARRVLIAVGGHLGDALLATAVFPPLRRALPSAEIGVLAPSWTAPVLAAHPAVRAFHPLDHWKLDRSGRPLVRRWLASRRSARAAVRELRRARYDLAIDLYTYFPNAIPVLWRAGIPTRVGFESGGFGPLLTTALVWTDGDRHVAERHLELLRAAGVDVGAEGPRYDPPPVPEAARGRAAALLAERDVALGAYVVLHMGVGSPLRAWPAERWQRLAAALVADGHPLVLTGAGAEDARRIAGLLPHAPGAVSLCDRASWWEFAAVLESARLVVSVNTVAGHLAAALGRPTVVLMNPHNNPAHWRPLGAQVTIVEAVPRPGGATTVGDGDAMATVGTVLRAVRGRLAGGAGER